MVMFGVSPMYPSVLEATHHRMKRDAILRDKSKSLPSSHQLMHKEVDTDASQSVGGNTTTQDEEGRCTKAQEQESRST